MMDGVVAAISKRPAPLIGRDADLAAIGGLLARARVVTLTGAPGVGKSRLAEAVASRQAGRYPGAVLKADLAPCPGEEAVGPALLAGFGLDPTPPLDPMAAVAAAVGDRRVLVLLDACEHVLDAVAGIVTALLVRCPGLSVLATSREPLDVPGEVCWRVSPLGAGTATKDAGSASAEVPPAVRLFLDHLRRAGTPFPSTPRNRWTAGEICRSLDGLPLAIEAAAAQSAVVPPDCLAHRLARGLGAIRSLGANQATHHGPLRSAVDRSHVLLAEDEQLLFRRLAVFEGGWTLDAAEAVCSDGRLPPEAVVDLLSALVRKSLVEACLQPNDRTRYRFLAIVGAYASDRLGESGEAGPVGARHAEWFTAMAEQAVAGTDGPERAHWLTWMSDERPNLDATRHRALGSGGTDTGLRLATATAVLFAIGGDPGESRRRLEAAATLEGDASTAVRAQALLAAGLLAAIAGDVRAAVAHTKDAAALAEHTGDRWVSARSRLVLGHCTLQSYADDGEQALALLAQGRLLANAAGDTLALLEIHRRLAWARGLQDGPDLPSLDPLLAAPPQSSGVDRAGEDLVQLARATAAEGAFEVADLALDDVMATAAGRAATDLAIGVLGARFELRMAEGDVDGAHEALARRLEVARDARLRSAVVESLCGLGELARHRKDLKPARRCFNEAVALSWEDQGPCWAAVLGLGKVAWALGDAVTAETLLARAAGGAKPQGEAQVEIEALSSLGDLRRAEGDLDRAAPYYHEALKAAAEHDQPQDLARSLEAIAGLAAMRGEAACAVRLFGAAASLRAARPWPPRLVDRLFYDHDLSLARNGFPPRELARAWAEGERMGPEAAAALAFDLLGGGKRPEWGFEALTPAQRSVAALVSDGLTNREVAERLSVSPRTVQTHLAHAFAKLGISSRRDLAKLVLARRQGPLPSLVRLPAPGHRQAVGDE